MKKLMMLTATVLLILATSTLLASAPRLFNYQGRLTDPSGNPFPDGFYPVRFSIYVVPTGGTALWSEKLDVSTNSGLFAVSLGERTPVPDSVVNDSVRYLGIALDGQELLPRQRLTSVLFAVNGGGWIDAGVSIYTGNRSAKVGIGTSTPTEQLEITGNLELPLSTASTGIIKSGGVPFLHNFGFRNTFLGHNAGNLSMTGGDNTASGNGAFYSNTTGSVNTASGAYALYSNTTGNSNTASGANALFNNTTGNENTASGTNALHSNTTGDSNTASGQQALYSNTSGSNNTASGLQALYNNSTGDSNTASGVRALYSNTTGINNTASGLQALYSNTTGNWNTANGTNALRNNTTGYYNTACGRATLYFNTTGYNNTAIGIFTLTSNTTGYQNTSSGRAALSSNTTGFNNTAIGFYADVTSGDLTNATAIGALAKVNASNKIRLGDLAVTVIEGQVAYTFTSDKNQKENFQSVDGDEVLRKIRGLSLTSWNYKNNDPNQFRHYGPMAQDFYAAFGHDGVGTCGDSVSINSGDMAGIMLIAIQTLEKENASMKARLEKVEAILSKLAGTVSDAGSNLVVK